jgi:hypothetical protein
MPPPPPVNIMYCISVVKRESILAEKVCMTQGVTQGPETAFQNRTNRMEWSKKAK